MLLEPPSSQFEARHSQRQVFPALIKTSFLLADIRESEHAPSYRELKPKTVTSIPSEAIASISLLPFPTAVTNTREQVCDAPRR
jgi:hypothetical protein